MYRTCMCRLAEASGKLTMSQKTAKELGTKLEQVQLARSTAEADLAIEKQWRVTLQVSGWVGGCVREWVGG